MSTENYASLFQMEHQILQHVKDALRTTLGWETSAVGLARKVSSVQFTMQSLSRHLERVMALEEEDGYMSSVRERRPNLYDRAMTLRAEHQEFRRLVERLVPALEQVDRRDEAKFAEICGDVADFLARIDRHDKQETKLLHATFFDDIGGEG